MNRIAILKKQQMQRVAQQQNQKKITQEPSKKVQATKPEMSCPPSKVAETSLTNRTVGVQKQLVRNTINQHRVFRDASGDGRNNCGFNAIRVQIPIKADGKKYSAQELRDIVGAKGSTQFDTDTHMAALLRHIKQPLMMFVEHGNDTTIQVFAAHKDDLCATLDIKQSEHVVLWKNSAVAEQEIRDIMWQYSDVKDQDATVAEVLSGLVKNKDVICVKHIPGHYQSYIHKTMA